MSANKETLFHVNGEEIAVQDVQLQNGQVQFTLGGESYSFRAVITPQGQWVLQQEMAESAVENIPFSAWKTGRQAAQIVLAGEEFLISKPLPGAKDAPGGAGNNGRVPMPGQIVEVLVAVGDTIQKGDAIAVMEAMKLQTTITAAADGVVEKLLVSVGDKVEEGAEILAYRAAQETHEKQKDEAA